MRRALTTLAAVGFLAVPVAGCGGDAGDADEDQIREVAAEFEEAVEAKDTEAFCALLAPSQLQDLGGEQACLDQFAPAKNVIFKADDTDMSVTEVEINGDTATATLANEGFETFKKEDGTWYVALIADGS